MKRDLNITIGDEAESGKSKHPYMMNRWKGTKEVQKAREAILAPDKGLCQKYDFRCGNI